MEFSLRGSLFILQFTESKTIVEALNYITSDENGYFNHPFMELEVEEDSPEKVCLICNGH